MPPSLPLDIHPEVAAALKENRPVAALSTAAIARTLPWPINLETARFAQDAARQEGVVLAILAVWRGRLAVGLEGAEVEALARGGNVGRLTRRDLAAAVTSGATAGLTVSSSMYLARRVGIRLLATGAIGGATRPLVPGEETTWDVSSDLLELSRTPVAVVSAGARNVHHLARTAEILETFSVPVIGYGTDTFPTFYLRAGTYPVPTRADSPAQLAKVLAVHWEMDGAGVVVAQPTPPEAALSPDILVPALQWVENQAASDMVGRRDLSPILMDKLNRLTGGKAVQAYQTILVANTRLAAQTARELNVLVAKAS